MCSPDAQEYLERTSQGDGVYSLLPFAPDLQPPESLLHNVLSVRNSDETSAVQGFKTSVHEL